MSFLKNYINADTEMLINSHNIEFGNELFAVLPYAYYHYKRGSLESTMSAAGTESLYYFSRQHIINTDSRHWANINKCSVPNVHVNDFTGDGEWYAPPYKIKYMNRRFVFDKPLYIVANKYNQEWNSDPVNYLDIDVLYEIFTRLKDYTVFYNRVLPDRLCDDQVRMDLGEHKVLRRLCPWVRYVHEIPGDYNTNQLMLYANCDNFISVQGGNSILASYFGGRNIIYAVRGNELGGFYDKLHLLSGCKIDHVMSYDDLIDAI